jgi:hypothetical protein
VPLSSNSRLYLLCLGYDLALRLLESHNVHCVAFEAFDQAQTPPSELVRTFNLAEAELLQAGWLERPHYATCLPSALLKGSEGADVGLFPVFGGQGVAWLRELSALYQTYPLAQGLIRLCLDALLVQTRSDEAKQVLGRGMLIDAAWITEGTLFISVHILILRRSGVMARCHVPSQRTRQLPDDLPDAADALLCDREVLAAESRADRQALQGNHWAQPR